MPDREITLTQKEIVQHFVFRFGALNGYRFGPNRGWTWAGHSPRNRREQIEAMDDNREQYVTDMRRVKEATLTQKEIVRHFVFRFGALNDNREQYVNDMRWVKEAVRLTAARG